MSWLQPTPFEESLVDDLRARWPEVLPLARLLSLATRVEPLLLRNARLLFLAGSATEIESLFWFSPLVGARSSGAVILHAGAARVLADDLRRDPALFDQALTCTLEHTRHWSPEERLEQDLRIAALRGEHDVLQQGVRAMLRRIHDEADEDQRIRLARWSRRSLATIAGAVGELPEVRLLAQYASCSLGGSADWQGTAAGVPAALPNWLAEKLPEPFRPAHLAVRLHYDGEHRQQVLHCLAAGADEPAIDLPTALPANLYVECSGRAGAWHVVGADTRIALPRTSQRVLLSTVDGRRYELLAELPPDVEAAAASAPTERLYLRHCPADREHAQRIADWLAKQGIAIELQEETVPDATATAAASALAEAEAAAVRVLHLWTHAAQAYWAEKAGPDALPGPRAALLRSADIAPPTTGQDAETVFDLPDIKPGQDAAPATDFLARLRAWLADEQPAGEDAREAADTGKDTGGDSDANADEAKRLLAELADRNTTPPRRLEIGDRLAEMGDPRPGVGVREVVSRDSGPDAALPAAESGPPEVDQLLHELEEPATIPPRRLAIGDRLAEVGDPRFGVSLDARGLPALDWVEIPGGEFIYQDGERRSLPRFFMARYPVTNAQYQAFIDAGGYEEKARKARWQFRKSDSGGDWWRDLKQAKPEDSRWPQANRPRTNVDWYEAVAFSRWLSAQLGYEVRLPTEEQWERAARGRDGREYPWGERYETGRANVNEKDAKAGEWDLGQTTAVGVYPQGASTEGALDLSGNVWEWCLNKYDRPSETAADTSGHTRVVRGGSWVNNPDGARAALRFGGGPDDRSDDGGFRLVSSAPIA